MKCIQGEMLKLGMRFTAESRKFTDLGENLFMNRLDYLLNYFGKGLAIGSKNKEDTWNRLVKLVHTIENSTPNPDVLKGFLEQLDKTSPSLVRQFLDIASKDDILVKCLVELHPISSFCHEDFNRCLNSLDHPKNKGHYYFQLFDEYMYKIMDNNKKEILIEKLLKKENCELTVISAIANCIIRNNQFRTETPSNLFEYALKASIKLIGQDIQIWKNYDALIAKVIKATFTRKEFHSKRFDWLHALFSAINLPKFS